MFHGLLGDVAKAPLRRPPSPARAEDSGMTLIEVIVAMGLFLVLLTVSSSVLVVALHTTEVNRDRVGAANLAGRELEIVRDQFTADTRGPETVTLNQVINENPLLGAAGSPVILDNVAYTVVRTAQWSAVGETAASACDDGTDSELAYLRVNVKVSWARMSGNPISMDTILTPPKGTYSSTTGHIGVKLVDAAGKPVSGHTVTAVGASGTRTGVSADDGCTVFAFLDPGPYTVTVDDNNYVNMSGSQRAQLNVTVQNGLMVHGSIDYDLSATVHVAFATADTYSTPVDKNIPVSFGNEGFPLGSIAKAGLTDPRDVAGLWPFVDGYQLWAGDCLDADPVVLRADAVTADPGGLTSAIVDLGPIHITSNNNGATVRAIHASDNSCSSGDIIRLGVIAGGKLDTSAPYGKWTLTTKSSGTRAGDPQVTLVRGDPPVSPPVLQ